MGGRAAAVRGRARGADPAELRWRRRGDLAAGGTGGSGRRGGAGGCAIRIGFEYSFAMSVSVQESLLDMSDEPVLGPLSGSVRRTRLSRGAWVGARPGWGAGSGEGLRGPHPSVAWRGEQG